LPTRCRANTRWPGITPLSFISPRHRAIVKVAAGHSPIAGSRIGWADDSLRRFLALQATGQAADAATSIVLAGVIVTEVEGAVTPAAVARALLTAAAPMVVAAPLAAAVADRIDRRRGLAATSVVRAALTVVAVAVPATGGALGYPTLAMLLVAARLAYTMRSAALPRVALARLVAADSAAVIVGKVAGFCGAAVGASLAVVSPAAGLALAAAAHFAAAYGWLTFRRHLGGGSRLRRARLPIDGTGITIGLTAVHRALLGAGFTTFGLLAHGRTDASAASYVAAGAAIGAGGLLGAIAMTRARAAVRFGSVVRGAFALAAVATIPAAAEPGFVTIATAVVAGSFCFQALRVVADAAVQQGTVDGLRGQSFSRYDVGHNLAFVAGGLAGVVAHGRLSTSAMLTVVGAGYAAGAVVSALTAPDTGGAASARLKAVRRATTRHVGVARGADHNGAALPIATKETSWT
jgi:hypothetical protein